MEQTEIDEISDAFSDAWKDYFADVFYLVPLSQTTPSDSVYSETLIKPYDYVNKKPFHAILKFKQEMDTQTQGGLRQDTEGALIYVRKELYEQSVYKIDHSNIVYYVDRNSVEHRYRITEDFNKVQLVNNWLFGSIGVQEIV